MLASIPSPSANGFHVGPLFFHFYGLCYVVGISAAVLLTRKLWREKGGDPDLVYTVALWGVPAGILGGRLYHDVTSWNEVPHNWYGWLAVWEGGLGIWGGIFGGVIGGLIPLKRAKVNIPRFMDATAPGLLAAQAIGRVGNYFNQELFGGPTKLPWALQISPAHRPVGYLAYSTFQPTFLYELIFDLALAAVLVWLIHHRRIRAPGIFALYVMGYSAFRIFEELLRVDPAHHFLGERLNFWVACILTLLGLAWFLRTQRGASDEPPPDPQRGAGETHVAVVSRRPPRYN
jgi:prolipoprotein diacylglyceryl transferase